LGSTEPYLLRNPAVMAWTIFSIFHATTIAITYWR
jgi:hypothetical protein